MSAVSDRIVSLGFQRRKADAMVTVLEAVAEGSSLVNAADAAGVAANSVHRWRKEHVEFRRLYEAARRSGDELASQLALEDDSANVLSTVPKVEGRVGLVDFRWSYFGRPTPAHQWLAVEALEDASNLYVFILGPTGMGKDTLAGDYVAWEEAPDTTGLRAAWFMESEDFSKRRMGRLSRYLVDPRAYDHVPGKTPGGQKPTRSLIEDYGPFRWEAGMVHESDRSPVQKTQWDALSKYFVRTHAPDQDPNLWATGMGGATYGSRISICVMSDVFTRENQKSPTRREDSYVWTDGTLDTRLDEDGRLVVIGTMLDVPNNYERMISEYTEGARVISEKTSDDGHSTYVKYSNGVAVVVIKAIVADPNTGEETSYWPEKFPLDTEYRLDGNVYLEKDLSVSEIRKLVDQNATLARGLRWRRQRMGPLFTAMYQQERDLDSGGDFTDETLTNAKHHQRSFGVSYAHELVVIGVDPARTYGAGWIALAVDRRAQTICVVDFFWGEKLGVTGIKNRLILEPLTKWNPVWLAYEVMTESAVLDDTLIKQAIQDSGVSVRRITTGRGNRSGPMISEVGSIAAYMRTGQWQVPYQTASDRARAEILFDHFRAWDDTVGRSKPGRSGHQPDDLAMAARAASIVAVELIEKAKRPPFGITSSVPLSVKRKYERRKKMWEASLADSSGKRKLPKRERVSALDIYDGILDNYQE